MIGKQDILDRAAEWHLRPEIVEKDYVLGWLLAGVASLPLRANWTSITIALRLCVLAPRPR